MAEAEFSADEVSGGVLVRFPKGRALTESFKRDFPRASRDTAREGWLVRGPHALQRAQQWLALRMDVDQTRVARTQAASADADKLARDMRLQGLPRVEGLSHPAGLAYLVLECPVDARLSDILDSLGASRAGDTTWHVPRPAIPRLREAERRLAPLMADALLAMERRRAALESRHISFVGEMIRLCTPYSRELASLCKSLPGATFHAETCVWMADARGADTHTHVLLHIKDLAAAEEANPTTGKRRGKGSPATPSATPGHNPYAAPVRRRSAMSFATGRPVKRELSWQGLSLIADAPAVGDLVEHEGRKVAVARMGGPFTVEPDAPRGWGEHLYGHVGEPCVYVYFREPTPADLMEKKPVRALAPRPAGPAP